MKSRQRKSKHEPLACLILAAGKGTRMYSAKNKVLHTLLGVPMAAYAVERARDIGATTVVAVLGHQKLEVARALKDRFGPDAPTVVEQKEQKGTGHAVRLGLRPLADFDGLVAILYGDVPLLQKETLSSLATAARRTGSLAMLTSVVHDPTGYGRVVRDDKGRIREVVEHKDATHAQLRIAEVNAGIYAAPAAFLREATAKLSSRNAQGELYLTDIVAKAAATIGVVSVQVTAEEMTGVNDRIQLVGAERILLGRLIRGHMKHATFRAPKLAYVEADVTIEPDVEIGRNVVLRGKTHVGASARIEDGAILDNVRVGEGAHLLPYCVIRDATIGENALIGPFAHLGPGTEVGPNVQVGSCIEGKSAPPDRDDEEVDEDVGFGDYGGYEQGQSPAKSVWWAPAGTRFPRTQTCVVIGKRPKRRPTKQRR